jgi:hypothetical protein
MVFLVRLFCNFGVRRITNRKTVRVDRLVYLPVLGALIVVWITIAAFTLPQADKTSRMRSSDRPQLQMSSGS